MAKRAISKRPSKTKKTSKRKTIKAAENVDPDRLSRFTNTISRMGLPSERLVTFRMCKMISVSLSSGAATFNVKANSVYQPFNGVAYTFPIGANTETPYGLSQWSSIYANYCVVSAKCSVGIVCRSKTDATADVNNPVLATLRVVDGVTGSGGSSSNYGNVETDIERGDCAYRLLASGGEPQLLSVVFDSKKFFNLADMRDNYGTHGAVFGADPVAVAQFRVGLQSPNSIANTVYCLVVRTQFTVVLNNPKDAGAS